MTYDQSPFEAERPLSSPRGRDRRRGMSDVLATLAALVAQRRDMPLLRGAFEEGVKRATVVRSVTLRDATSRWSRVSERNGIESIALDVAGWSPRTAGVLEATFEPGCRLGEWDFQQLKCAAHLGTLILELERLKTPGARIEPPPVAKEDGAAPLIGSTPVMAVLRRRIERIAGTDFTVLLEGPSDPQAHPDLGAFPKTSRARGATMRPPLGRTAGHPPESWAALRPRRRAD